MLYNGAGFINIDNSTVTTKGLIAETNTTGMLVNVNYTGNITHSYWFNGTIKGNITNMVQGLKSPLYSIRITTYMDTTPPEILTSYTNKTYELLMDVEPLLIQIIDDTLLVNFSITLNSTLINANVIYSTSYWLSWDPNDYINESGYYTLEITAYDIQGNVVDKTVVFTVEPSVSPEILYPIGLLTFEIDMVPMDINWTIIEKYPDHY
jgi:hypothetical protein